MASTGAYRQALQQLFVIQIEDESYQQNSNETDGDNGSDDFTPLHDFEEPEQQQVQTTQSNTNNANIQNNTIIQDNQELDMNNLTDTMIDEEFAEFLEQGVN